MFFLFDQLKCALLPQNLFNYLFGISTLLNYLLFNHLNVLMVHRVPGNRPCWRALLERTSYLVGQVFKLLIPSMLAIFARGDYVFVGEIFFFLWPLVMRVFFRDCYTASSCPAAS